MDNEGFIHFLIFIITNELKRDVRGIMGFLIVIPCFMADAISLHCGLSASGLDLL